MLKNMKQKFIKETIINETKKQLLEKGIQKTTIRSIANELGIVVGNLYYYYKTKADLCEVVWASYTQEYITNFKKAMEDGKYSGKSGLDILRIYYKDLYDYFRDNPLYAELIAFLMGEKPRSERAPKDIQEVADNAREKIRSFLSDIYRSGIDDGSIHANIPDVTLEAWSFNIAYVFLIVNIIRYHETDKSIYEYFVNQYFNRLAISPN